jgi:hypothetical protein
VRLQDRVCIVDVRGEGIVGWGRDGDRVGWRVGERRGGRREGEGRSQQSRDMAAIKR